MNAIGIVGWKNSGKTTLVSRLIPALQSRGLSVSTIKHVHHDVDLDLPGKDTFVHREAGAVDVVMYSDKRWAILHEQREQAPSPPSIDDMISKMTPVDLVLVEGFKHVPMSRLEIRGEGGGPAMTEAGVRGIIGIVTDGDADADLPIFGRDEIDLISDFLEEAISIPRITAFG